MEPTVAVTRRRARSIQRWQDIVRENFLPLEFAISARQDFHSRLTARSLGDAHFACVSAGAQRVIRTPGLAARSERGYCKLYWQLAGHSRVEQGGRRGELRAGEWTCYDTARPYQIDIAHGSRFAVMLLPAEVGRGWSESATARVFPARGAAGAALASVLSVLADDGACDAFSAERIVSSVADLMQAASSAGAGALPEAGRRRLERARRYIISRLDDPDLTPADVAAALHVSRRTLYACFSGTGESPVAYIQHERLERCRRMMADPSLRHMSITRIALDAGFGDIAHFSRRFKGAYGTSPRDYRKRFPG